MTAMDLLPLVLVLVGATLLAIPTGRYLALVYSLEPTRLDRFFAPVETVVYRLCGMDGRTPMGWKTIAGHFLFMVLLFTAVGYALLRFQGFMPLNPDGLPGLEPTLAFNTALSFANHAELQNYSGEVNLTNFTQMALVLSMMFGPAATGMSIAMPMLRGFTGQPSLGNFHQDMVRTIVRVILPISFVMTLVLVALGVPQTLTAKVPVQTLEGAQQVISIGPVAVIESIKQLLSNGGGFFNVNAAHPYENPSPLTNVIHMVSMLVIPGALVIMVGHMLRNRRQGWFLYGSLFLLLVAMSVLTMVLEKQGNPVLERTGLSQSMGNMEGKEVRFGTTDSSLFTAITGATMTGSVNTMHDSLTPLGGMVPLLGILVNAVFGETGAGVVSIFLHLMLAVFIAGLMVGRTPELFGKQIENTEMKLVVKLFLILPLAILVPTIIALFTSAGTAGISNPGAHGFTQVFYEYASSVASNGSAFGGMNVNAPFWNISTGIVILLGRCLPMIVMLAIANSLHQKRVLPATVGTIKIDSISFGLMFIGTIIVVGALSYLPFLALGPISEWLQIR